MDADRLGVLVGMDQSECARQALDWAVAEAAARGAPLTIAHVLNLPRIADVPLSPELVAAAERDAQQALDAALGRARRAAPGLPVGSRVASGNPAAELLQLAAAADLVVLGSRGHGGFATLLLGSVAGQVAAHAPSPVAVVRGQATAGGPVIVGVDGSERSETALEHGFGYAARHSLPLRALHFYSHYVPAPAPPYPVPPVDLDRVRDEAARFLARAVDRWAGKHPEVPAEWAVAGGSAARHLVEASEGASLLVVGCRGHGGFAGMLLGSVSQAAVRHAHCPVVVAH